MLEPMRSYIFAGIAERGREGYGLYFPDLPGCVTAADTLEALPANAREALELHLTGMIEDGEAIPMASDIGALPHDPEVDEVGVLLVEAQLAGEPTALSVTQPASLVARIDAAAQARGVSRDAILAESAEELLKAG
jgi:predicted RNase H-like HicB family nuclease